MGFLYPQLDGMHRLSTRPNKTVPPTTPDMTCHNRFIAATISRPSHLSKF